jgi:hypothetical protein
VSLSRAALPRGKPYSGRFGGGGVREPAEAKQLIKVQFAPCPGQKLVLYDGDDKIIAGGTIVSFVKSVRTTG